MSENVDGAKSGITKVQIQPGSKMHKVSVEENAEPEHAPEHTSERRRATATPVNLQFGGTGGLTGWAATIANMSAVGFVMLMMFFIYQDFRTNVKENQAMNREEIKLNRDLSEKNNQALVATMQNQTLAFNTAFSANTIKLDALMLHMQTLVSELKAERTSDMAKFDKILEAIKLLKSP